MEENRTEALVEVMIPGGTSEGRKEWRYWTSNPDPAKSLERRWMMLMID